MDTRLAGMLAASMFVAVVVVFPAPGMASDPARNAAADACIAAHSGADSIDCLQAIADAADAELSALDAAFLARAQARRDADDIGDTHHTLATSGLQSATRAFEIYVEHQCEAEVGLSGAVASGSGQIDGTCRIRLKDDRIAHLRALLARDAQRNAASSMTSFPSPTSPGIP
jgi:uncharacterized protein YecT (DUF1311 family)